MQDQALHNLFSDAAAQIILLSSRIGFPNGVDHIYAKGASPDRSLLLFTGTDMRSAHHAGLFESENNVGTIVTRKLAPMPTMQAASFPGNNVGRILMRGKSAPTFSSDALWSTILKHVWNALQEAQTALQSREAAMNEQGAKLAESNAKISNLQVEPPAISTLQ